MNVAAAVVIGFDVVVVVVVVGGGGGGGGGGRLGGLIQPFATNTYSARKIRSCISTTILNAFQYLIRQSRGAK